jgi:hypothetical protein
MVTFDDDNVSGSAPLFDLNIPLIFWGMTHITVYPNRDVDERGEQTVCNCGNDPCKCLVFKGGRLFEHRFLPKFSIPRELAWPIPFWYSRMSVPALYPDERVVLKDSSDIGR